MSDDVAHVSCRELVELVTDYLESALDDATRERFEHHLHLCPGCEVYVEQMRVTAARLGHIPVDSLTPEAQATLLDAFRDFKR